MESAEEAETLSNQWDYSLVPGFTASKILWLKNKEPENFARLRKVLLPHDFLNFHLTGRYCMEVWPPFHAEWHFYCDLGSKLPQTH